MSGARARPGSGTASTSKVRRTRRLTERGSGSATKRTADPSHPTCRAWRYSFATGWTRSCCQTSRPRQARSTSCSPGCTSSPTSGPNGWISSRSPTSGNGSTSSAGSASAAHRERMPPGQKAGGAAAQSAHAVMKTCPQKPARTRATCCAPRSPAPSRIRSSPGIPRPWSGCLPAASRSASAAHGQSMRRAGSSNQPAVTTTCCTRLMS